LPVAVSRIEPGHAPVDAALRVHATERQRDGDAFIYDLDVKNAQGQTCERWRGLRLQTLLGGATTSAWPLAVARPYLERVLADHFPTCALAFELLRADADGTGARGIDAVARAYGSRGAVTRRPDGKLELADTDTLTCSAATCGPLTLGVFGCGPVACDLEVIAERTTREWDVLLGAHAAVACLIAANAGEPFATAATRVWTALECRTKAGIASGGALVVETVGRGGVVRLRSGTFHILTAPLRLIDIRDPLIVAFLAADRPERRRITGGEPVRSAVASDR
jgi:enediyne polyketide synthase